MHKPTQAIIAPENQHPAGNAASIRLALANYCEDLHDLRTRPIAHRCRNETKKTGIASFSPQSRQCEKP
jgi:hypothetical protein